MPEQEGVSIPVVKDSAEVSPQTSQEFWLNLLSRRSALPAISFPKQLLSATLTSIDSSILVHYLPFYES